MYNHELTLISYEVQKDNIGNEIKVPIEKNVLCKIKDIGSGEFYDAKVSGLKPEKKFIVHKFEYEDQKEIEFENDKYKVLRTFSGSSLSRDNLSLKFDEIELTCEKVR